MQAQGFRVAVFICLAVILVSQSARCDVIFTVEEDKWPTVALSLEGVGSIERLVGDRQSVSVWGGMGSVWDPVEGNQSLGVEIAAEARVYTRTEHHAGLSGGAYLGLALLESEAEGTRFAVTPGAKFTLSAATPSSLVWLEPYIGVSYPLVRDLDGREWKSPDAPFVTLGLRLVFRHIIPRGDDTSRLGA